KSADQKIRDEIRTNFKDNLFITAGAGTGKTQSIVDRITDAICNQGFDPEKIAVTTFTEKAANELLFKIRTSLGKKDKDKAGVVQKMFIGTNHSLCLTILKERPLESAIDPEADAMDQDESDMAIAEVSEAVIKEYFDTPQGKDLYTKWEFDPYSAIDFFKTLNMYRELTPVDVKNPNVNMKGFWQRHNKKFKKIPNFLDMNDTDAPNGYEWFERKYKEWAALKGKNIDEVIRYCIHLKVPASGKTTWTSVIIGDARKTSLMNYVFPPFQAVQEEVKSYISYELYKIYRDLYRKFLPRYDAWKNERGCLDFSDMLLKAREIVRDNREVREYFQQRFDLVIVDEFQDTDPIMCEILMYICQDGYKKTAWDSVNLAPGKITVVGDAKQSIYRFRRADIAVYNRAGKLFETEGKVFTLSENFRSVKALIESHNHAFKEIFDKADSSSEQVSYDKISAYRPGNKKDKKHLVFLDMAIDLKTDEIGKELGKRGGLNAEYKYLREAYTISRRLKNIVQKKEFQVDSRPAEYGDFMLLFKRRTIMRKYATLLSREGIPVAMDGEGFILELPEVIDLFRFLKGCVQPEDSVAVVAALRSMFIGITDEELYQHKIKGGHFNYLALNDKKGIPPVNDALKNLKKYNLDLNSSPELLSQMLQEKHFRQILGQTRRTIGYNIFDSLIGYIESCSSDDVSASEIINTIWDGIYEKKKLDPAFYPSKRRKEVQMMTIHKAKGLESSIVVLCDIGTAGSKSVYVIFDRKNEKLYYKFGVEGRSRYRNSDYKSYIYSASSNGFDTLVDAEKQSIDEEGDRLVYVAATRAKDYLIIPTYKKAPAGFYNELHGHYRDKKLFTSLNTKLPKDYTNEIALPAPDVVQPQELDSANKSAYQKAKRIMNLRDQAIAKIKVSATPSIEHKTFSHARAMQRESAGYGPEYGTIFHRVMEVFVRDFLGTSGSVSPNQLKGVMASLDSVIKRALQEENIEFGSKQVEQLKNHALKTISSKTFKECLAADTR
ncbi:MAG: UvrD-helicase domain-containing protein, partial [Desulfobulbaceae bacterium]|nr:UvrD-helicase domain-containing protein [Desulfobulbaceae bacterium]